MFSCSAPCKINLSLRILGKREDGFHELDTLMAPLELGDELRFERSREMELTCNDLLVPTDASNLVLKAVDLFTRRTGMTNRYAIDLVKRVPSGAGLGGGSSDAAATLMALNEMEVAGLRREELAGMAAEIGSDVAFFIYGQICRCTGRGEIIQPEPSLAAMQFPVVLLKPSFPVSTPFAYRNWGSSRELPDVHYGVQEYAGIRFVNDLERPVFEKFLFLAEVKEWLLAKKDVQVAMMSGSGSTMFAVVSSLEEGQRLIEEARSSLDPTLWSWCGMCGAV